MNRRSSLLGSRTSFLVSQYENHVGEFPTEPSTNDTRSGTAGSPTGGSGKGQAVGEGGLGSRGDGARYSGNGVIVFRRLPEESPAFFVFKGAFYT